MSVPKLIVAVEAVGTTAAAVIYDPRLPPPAFVYADRHGRKRQARLDAYTKLPESLRAYLRRYVKTSAESWAVVSGDDRTMNMGLSVARAIERLRHKDHTAWARLGRQDVLVVHTARHALPGHLLDGAPQAQIGHRIEDWRVCAAYVLAKNDS